MDLRQLYRHMYRARAFELAIADLWSRGLISGEMHLGTGEEAVAAGVVSCLQEGDGLALDHRPTPELVVRGIELVPMLREMLGRDDGLCRGRGGHMHLFSREHLAASSGIVGSSAPLAAGFALAAQQQGRRSAAVAFLGDGALNQGMALETLNLAVAWSLPLIIVCKDNRWAITTVSSKVTGGDLLARAQGFGMSATRVDGADVLRVHEAAQAAIARARRGKGPTFLLAECPRLDGHFLGDPLVRMAKSPLGDGRDTMKEVMTSAVGGAGEGIASRALGVATMVGVMARARSAGRDGSNDPIVITRKALRDKAACTQIEDEVTREMAEAVEAALRD